MADPPPRPRPAPSRDRIGPSPVRGWQPRRTSTKPLPPPAPTTIEDAVPEGADSADQPGAPSGA
jgi:hypothetical protein